MAGRVFLVSGGTSGLGLAGARALIAEGARVTVLSRDPDHVDRAIRELGVEDTVGLAADMTDPSYAERAVAATIARFGRLDGCLISTGGPPAGTVLSSTEESWRNAFDQLILGTIRLVRAVATAVTVGTGPSGTGGSVLVVLSTSARSPIPGLSISNALRPGVAMMVKDLADELGPRGIRVNGLAPGRFATDRVFMLDARVGSPEIVRRRHEMTIPLTRYGQPDEFGRMATIMLSPASSYLNGTVVYLDGGALRCP